uniref:B- and T-lymphocyte attenuator-like n=1 Tax=Semicossyphus pulcher TaxID=241346 RepID=UPI0037E8A63A
MRPNRCWSVLPVFTLAGLLLTLKADSEDSECYVSINVRRNTVYKAFLGGNLKIHCTVTFCNNSPPTVSWFKREQTDVPVNVSSTRFKTEWKTLKPLEGASFLIFQDIVRNDSGVYQCRSGQDVGHGINISIYDYPESNNETQKNDTNSTTSHTERKDELWLYVYAAAGILAFVVIVIIISVASMRGCKGKSEKGTIADNQYAAIPMVEQPFPGSSVHPSPRGSPSAPPPQRSTRRKTPPPQHIEPPLPRDHEAVYSRVREDRKRQRNTMEEDRSSLVYAALNHQVPARPVARPRRQLEENSEYAAIRIKDPNSC